MTITNGYTTRAEYKSRFYDEGQGDTKDDAAIDSVIEAVSREIDDICWQRFFTTDAAEARYFTAEHKDILFLPRPIITMSTLLTDDDGDRSYENTWVIDTDYDMMPFNAVANSEPFKWIATTPNGNYKFPVGVTKGVKITAKFGWITVPKPIVEACLLGAHRLMARRNSPLGVSGAAAMGNMVLTVETLKADPDFMSRLQPYIVRY